MNTQGVLSALPARLEWVVFFRLEAVARFAADETMCRMFFLPEGTRRQDYSHVVLTSAGRYLAASGMGGLMAIGDSTAIEVLEGECTRNGSLIDLYPCQLETFALGDADCIGIGGNPDGIPAFLHVKLGEHFGEATALLATEPNVRDYDLLPAIGVDYLGGGPTPLGYRCRFRNRLAGHIKAGALSGFTRTENCNRFFFEHARIDASLAAGLKQACADRLGWARATIKTFVHKLSAKAIASPLAMTCVPPPPEASFPYGDLVPLGFLLRGMKAINLAEKAPALLGQVHDDLVAGRLRRHLNQARNGRLWAFHTDRLVTATDSALILLGMNDPDACAELEQFADGNGAYVPQLWSDQVEPGKMLADSINAHWRQPDFATTCLIRGLRIEAGLDPLTSAAVLDAGFSTRSGLFFANPYLVDWCLALAVSGDNTLASLATRLRDEVLASANTDGSYGGFDPALSTGLAILTLDALGYRGRALRLAQLRLLEMLDSGPWPVSTPFYSTFACPDDDGSPPKQQHFRCGETLHALSLYRDGYRIVFASVVALAVSITPEVDDDEPQPGAAVELDPHPRYRCQDVAQYVQAFALPPYVVAEPVGC